MSIGDGIFYAAMMIALVLLYTATKDRWRWRVWTKRIALTIILFLVFGCVAWIGVLLWQSLPLPPQTQYADLELGLPPSEVIYRKGTPKIVYESSKDPAPVGWKEIVEVKNIPKGKRVQDYSDWAYDDSNRRIDVDFDPALTKIVSIQCYSKDSLGRCPTIGGINDGDSESAVISKFGTPDVATISGLTKRMTYEKIGVYFLLEKQRVYMLGINNFGLNKR
jgi:hypothetical protein